MIWGSNVCYAFQLVIVSKEPLIYSTMSRLTLQLCEKLGSVSAKFYFFACGGILNTGTCVSRLLQVCIVLIAQGDGQLEQEA